MKVVLLAHTPTPEQTVAAAARLCYSDTDVEALRESISQERAEQFVEMLAGFGHESPVEHVTFTFGIEGVSRSFLAQVTRHRIASFSVQSQRYVRQDHFVFVTPPAIAAEPELLREYENAMQQSIDSYNRLARWRRNMCRNFWHRAAPKRQPAPRRRKRQSRTHGMCCPTPVKPK